jgi:mitochondrial chaperone BCS1
MWHSVPFPRTDAIPSLCRGGNLDLPTGSVVARNNSILKQLVLQAKKEYEVEAVHRIQIYFADSYGSWRYTDSRHKRPLSSIVLNPGVKEMLVADAKDFLKSEKVGTHGSLRFMLPVG